MTEDSLKKAADMLLGGATMLGEPCPYCSGVRVIKDGSALCANCGRSPDESLKVPPTLSLTASQTRKDLESRLVELTGKLGAESDETSKKAILDEINALVEAIAKLYSAK